MSCSKRSPASAMREDWEEYPLSELLERVRRPLQVLPGGIYHQIGIRSFGKGLFHKAPATADEIGNKRLFVIEDGDLVFNIVFAWEGAAALAGPAEHGKCGSHRFPTYRPNQTLWLPRYAELFFQAPPGLALLRNASPGSAGRNKTLNQTWLMQRAVRVPSLAEQHDIVDALDAAVNAVSAALRHQQALAALGRAQRHASMNGPWEEVRLEEAAEVTMGRQRSPKYASGEHMHPYLRAANVKDARLALDDVLTMNFAPDEQLKYQLQPGDVLVSEGAGSLAAIGASARWEAELGGVVCFQNTLLRLRSYAEHTDAGFLYFWARWAFESGAFAKVASGTNIFHIGSTRAKAMPVALPPLDEQLRLTALLEDIEAAEAAALHHLQSLTSLHTSLLAELLTEGAAPAWPLDAAAA